MIVLKKMDSAGTSTNSELVVSALSSAEIAGDAETADTSAIEAAEHEPIAVVAAEIESDTTEIVNKFSKNDTLPMFDEQSEHFEKVCVADADKMDVEDNVVNFEKEGGSVFKIPVKRKKKSCGKVLFIVIK